MTHLKLAEFREAYRRFSRGKPIWLKHLILGLLVWIEERYIDAKVKAEVNRAIAEWDYQVPVQEHIPFTFVDDLHIRTTYEHDRITRAEASEGDRDR